MAAGAAGVDVPVLEGLTNSDGVNFGSVFRIAAIRCDLRSPVLDALPPGRLTIPLQSETPGPHPTPLPVTKRPPPPHHRHE